MTNLTRLPGNLRVEHRLDPHVTLVAKNEDMFSLREPHRALKI
jgi:hypothetical protein